MESTDITAIMRRAFDGLAVPGKTYPRPLPPALAPWYVYVADSGHCIAAITTQLPAEYQDAERWEQLVPVPVRAVLEGGYQLRDGYVYVDIPYGPTLGLLAPDGTEEW